MSKYHAKKVLTTDGLFDSKKELDRWRELKLLEIAGRISNLQRQVTFKLIPAQFATVDGKRRCLERAVTYKADFVYDCDGERIVEDAKGCKTEVYRLKKKLMLYLKGIRIKET